MYKIFLSFVTLALISSSNIHAYSRDNSAQLMNGLYVSGEGAVIIPFDSDLDLSAYVRAQVGYWWTDNVATEIQIGFASIDSNIEDLLKLDIIPLLVNVRVDLPLDLGPDLHAYLYGGAGILFSDTDNKNLEVDDSFAGQIGLGIQYYFTDNISASIDARLLFSSPDLEVGGIAVGDALDLNSFLLGGNITIDF